MGILLSTQKNENLQIGLVWAIQTMDAKANFALVKNMPAKATAVRTPKSLDPGVVQSLFGKAPFLGPNIPGGTHRV